jgi:hypothetical protein
MRLHLRSVRLVTLTVLMLAASTPAWSQGQSGGFAKEGGFAGVSFVPGFTFDGVTFDGETVYQKVGGEEIVFLPKIDKQPLIRAILGYRAKQVALEISYDRTAHDGTFGDFPMEATFQAVNVDGRYYFAPSSRIQPHVLAGGSFPWFRVKDGSFLDPDVGDARFRGYGVNTEAGVTVYPHRQLGIGAGYAYRVIWFDRATGVADELGELRPRFRETSGAVTVTATYVF